MKGTSVRERGDAALGALPRDERIRALRGRMAAIGVAGVQTSIAAEQSALAGIIPVPEALSGLLPGGGLARRTMVCMNECPTLAVHLLVHAARHGETVGVVGWPELCFAEMSEYEDVFARVVYVPDPGIEPLSVAATLSEGLDLVFCYLPQKEVTPSRARPLLGKLRRGTASIIVVGAQVSNPAVRLRATVRGFHGVGRGTGRIRTLELSVEVSARGLRNTATMHVGEPVRRAEMSLLRVV